ncbi:hypothetical protein HGRIS_002066 [Hohenbuehelia grisea]|uniref:BZIP domain-containing protein n=1 Tax=Hohenbuehelia grisea TaxID=104357 RepID=A0ABR3JJB3_9AGAR
MHNQPPPLLNMSHILAHDAPLLSPMDCNPNSLWSPMDPTFHYNFYNLPPSPPTSVSSASTSPDSPIPPNRMLKMRMSPDAAQDANQLCLPTHKVFDFPPEQTHIQHQQQYLHHQLPTPPTVPELLPPKQQPPPLMAINTGAIPPTVKRSASPSPAPTKKRTIGERISSKDFIPPDVSGLTKREARLVKNRAAAFLSRQRKREEFEAMEIRVAELEQENARLQAMARNGNAAPSSPPNTESASQMEQLRAQLAAAEQRERELNAELARKEAEASQSPVKEEAQDISLESGRSTPIQPSHKSNASLGLMALLCAIPSLLSGAAQSTVPATFSIPTALSSSSSSFDFNSYLPGDYDWSRNGVDAAAAPTPKQQYSGPRRLEFADIDPEALSSALGGLDISFESSPSDDGKIRVRIHPPSASSSRATSPTSTSSGSSGSMDAWPSGDNSFDQATFGAPDLASFGLAGQEDPFLGMGGISDYLSTANYGQAAATTAETRRVRIALKSPPTEGGEGGEWEVQFC